MMNNPNFPSDSLSLAPSSQNNSLIVAQILSQTPGRIRLRIASFARQIEQINEIAVDLRNQLGIERVRANFDSGTITVFHNPNAINSVNILQRLTNLGVIFSAISPKSPSFTPEYSKAAMGVTQVTQDLNQRVRQASNGIIDLGFLVPLSFGILAWRQLMVKGWQLEIIPWYVLAWYAFDSFIKLQRIDRGSLNIRQQD